MTARRMLDMVGSAVGLVVLSPLLLLVALLIKMDDGGPVFFSQQRVGLGGKPFLMYKFRSMQVRSEPGSMLTTGTDPRITRLGRWIRRFKLDELPQLWNVLVGDMALVGPRPEVERFVALYTPEQRKVLDYKPGLTDPASLRFWDESDQLAASTDPEQHYVTRLMPEKIRLQLAYSERASIWTDIAVGFRTIMKMWSDAQPMLINRLLGHRKLLIVLSHVVLFVLGWRLAFELRFDFAIPSSQVLLFWTTLPVILIVRLASHAAFGLYSGYWRHTSLPDLGNLVKATMVGSIIIAVVLYLDPTWRTAQRSVLLMECAATILLSGGVRFLARYLKESHAELLEVPGRNTLVIGTRSSAARLLRDARHDGRRAISVVGLVSIGGGDRGSVLHGVKVVGALADLNALIALHQIELLVIALDAPDAQLMHEVVKVCSATGIEFKTLPSLEELLEGTARPNELRQVRIEDLLGRGTVQLDVERIEAEVAGAVVLVTGGGGSIGSELARQIARLHPGRLVLLDQAETPLFYMEQELRAAWPQLDTAVEVGDVTDSTRMGQVFRKHRPDVVFHAAAYKHVPMMEANLGEAVRNNVIGTLTVAQQAAAGGARKFVLISTDKAVNPSSIMGASKRAAEKIVLGLPVLRTGRTDFRAVRFGNVLGSNGSVVPVFEQQLRAGGPLTVTHPDVERYFMTIPEAVQLVLAAAVVPEAAGCISMLDMGQPVRIVELAEKLIRLSGREPYRDVPIVFTGLRPGEKLQEELMSSRELTVPTTVEHIRVVHTSAGDHGRIERAVGMLIAASETGEAGRLRDALLQLVPEYQGSARDSHAAHDHRREGAHRVRPVPA